jgi:hypothetical protein
MKGGGPPGGIPAQPPGYWRGARARWKFARSYPLNMRTTKELRDKIEAAATVSGRSLVQEVEFRLEQSFQMDDAAKQSETVAVVAVKAALKVVEDLLARGASAKALGLAVERVGAAAAEADFEKDLTKKEDDNGKAS